MRKTEKHDAFAMRDAARAMMRRALRPDLQPQSPQDTTPGVAKKAGGLGMGKPALIGLPVLAIVMAICVVVVVTRPLPRTSSPLASVAQVPAAAQAAAQGDNAPDGDLPDAEAVLAQPTDRLRIVRLDQMPTVAVLLFPSLHAQAMMLNRIGAFIEKRAAPRDRVLDDASLRALTAVTPGGYDGYYYGHDYRAADLARFFAAADADGIELNADEAHLREMLAALPMLHAGSAGAIITLPPVSASPPVDRQDRAAILQHEISHGVYFTDPAYAEYTAQFWATMLTESQRDGFRHFLGGEGYDAANEDLMRNEMQAYLIHTPDRRYFQPRLAGLDAAEAGRLRARFIASMQGRWMVQ